VGGCGVLAFLANAGIRYRESGFRAGPGIRSRESGREEAPSALNPNA
jgi:hypothetical protein